MDVFKQLALRLDALPHGYPSTDDGVELELLAYLFTGEQAELASQLRLTKESARTISERLGRDFKETKTLLKIMMSKGLIAAGAIEGGIGFGILPFVVGIYEFQGKRIDEKMAGLFEAYYQESFGHMLAEKPQIHRVIPINEAIQNDMEVQPFENAVAILDTMKSWGVLDCICRKQKAMIGDPCEHPVEICMTFSEMPGYFDHSSTIRPLTREEALDKLQEAADAGLVHSVSNNQEGLWYICNCCTCSCGILRGMADLGIANVVAKSAFVNQVDTDLCTGCEICNDSCQFGALEMDGLDLVIHDSQCVGCGVCIPACPTEALSLARRPENEILMVPVTEHDWMKERAKVRKQDLNEVL